jgi:hypothetical protein
MGTVIAEDRIARFAELDHTVVEEVRVLAETVPQEPAPRRESMMRRLRTTLLASIRLSQPS